MDEKKRSIKNTNYTSLLKKLKFINIYLYALSILQPILVLPL